MSADCCGHDEGRIEREEYGRYGNPTVRAAENRPSSKLVPQSRSIAIINSTRSSELSPSSSSVVSGLTVRFCA